MALTRQQIARRAAQEIKDGFYVNLGIGREPQVVHAARVPRERGGALTGGHVEDLNRVHGPFFAHGGEPAPELDLLARLEDHGQPAAVACHLPKPVAKMRTNTRPSPSAIVCGSGLKISLIRHETPEHFV